MNGLHATRAEVENAIEMLVTLLDRIDGDDDLEDGNDDETYITGSSTDREAETDDYEPYLSAGAVEWGSSPPASLDAEGDEAEADGIGFIEGGQGL